MGNEKLAKVFKTWSNESENGVLRSYKWVYGVIVVGMGMLLARAVFLQVVMGNDQVRVAEGNRLVTEVIRAERGVIKDDRGELLAENVEVDGEVKRYYPLASASAHLTGYIGAISEEELARVPELGRFGVEDSVIGKTGIELYYDDKLRGEDGEELWEVSARGEKVRLLAKKEAQAGNEIVLNVQSGLQLKILELLGERESEFGEYGGSVIVSEVGTGRVIGLASWPVYDPNLFTLGEASGEYKTVEEVIGDIERKPMFDRAIGGAYPPGSVYKLVTAMAGLSEGELDRGTVVEDTGEIKIGPYRYGNWYFDQYGGKEGNVDLKKALARSNDIFFYKTGEWLGIERLGDWSRRMGLGERLGVDLPGEARGVVPDPFEKEKRTGERWFLGNTYHMAIGQGDLLTTPMQINMMTGAVISGRRCVPKVARGEADCVELGLAEHLRRQVWEGMLAACSRGEDYNGTAFTFFDSAVPIACKTGTAQQGGEDDDPHAWITVVVPEAKEEGNYELEDYTKGVVVTVMLEASGEGSAEAGSVARPIVDYLLGYETKGDDIQTESVNSGAGL